MDAQYTQKPAGWKRFEHAVRANFPGGNNAGLRKQIYALAESGDGILGLARTVALTASGLAGLRECDTVLSDWDGRSARRQHAAHQSLA